MYASDASGAVQMTQSAEPTQVVYVERLPPSPSACRLAPGTSSSQPEPFCDAERLNEEPDREKPFVRFCEGLRHNRCMAEIGWHRRETRRQTENTNVMPGALEGLILLDKSSAVLHLSLRINGEGQGVRTTGRRPQTHGLPAPAWRRARDAHGA